MHTGSGPVGQFLNLEELAQQCHWGTTINWCLHSNPNLLISPGFVHRPRVSKADMNSRGWIMMFARCLEVWADYWGISSQNRFLALVELLNSVTIFRIRSLFLPWLKSRSASWFHRFNWTFSYQNQILILSPNTTFHTIFSHPLIQIYTNR